MNLLLDTHTLIWFLDGNKQLSSKARKAIESDLHLKFVSMASIWEFAIKRNLKKIQFQGGTKRLVALVDENGFSLLPILPEHIYIIESLAYFHGDPFDRIIIAQAMTDNLTVLTKDKIFSDYKVEVLW